MLQNDPGFVYFSLPKRGVKLRGTLPFLDATGVFNQGGGMNDLFFLLAGVVLGLAVAVFWLMRRRRQKLQADFHHTLQQIRQVGQLVVLRMYVQQIVTAEQHIAGRWKDLFKWLLDSAKVALIIEYDIGVLFDLQDPAFRIEQLAGGRIRFVLPPCQHRTSIRQIQFYDERNSRWFPWLLGDITSALGPGISEERKNQLLQAARNEVEQKAQQMVLENSSQIFASARQTLEMLARGFGVSEVEVTFAEEQARREQSAPGQQTPV